jgi:molybdopterin biosynthesis enzyme
MAALVAFETLVKPFLLAASGLARPTPEFINATLATEVRKRRGIFEFVPVGLKSTGHELVASPLAGRSSHMFGGLALANGLAALGEVDGVVEAGRQILVIPWGA